MINAETTSQPPPQDEPCPKASPSSKAAADKKLLTFLTLQSKTSERQLLLCVSICMHVSLGLPRHTELQTAPSTAAHLAVGAGSWALALAMGNTELFAHHSP